MLIRQAAPSFEAFFGQPPPEGVDVRKLCLEALEKAA
jgi:shikimate dehydrogenase